MLHIFIDADACPVKDEVYRVASRCNLNVTLVANSWMRIPTEKWINIQIVDDSSDAADDWIVEKVEPLDIVITADIPLASRCIKKQAKVIGPNGKSFTENNIGNTLATRNLMTDLRSAGEQTKGPAPLTNKDRSNFLQQLDKEIQAIRRKAPKPKI